uniref:Uncharacterized protein n=1 Tax=Avena sativa TaxID=4498 RepID=A0ACD5V267_AVESA
MRAMKCKRHPYECGVGVCASCLRDRLLALAAAQNKATSLPPPSPEPVPLFPRSVSPYVCPRKSDASGPWSRQPSSRLFFRTPQVEPTYGGGAGFEEGDIGFQIRRHRRSKLSALSALFGHHGSEEKGGGGRERKHGSWFAGIMPRGRRKKESTVPATAPLSPRWRRSSGAVSNRGLSPVRFSDEDTDESSSVADSPWRPSPIRKPPCRRLMAGAGGAGAGVSGFSVCISPLVRPSTARHHRGGHPPDAPALSGELRPSPLHQPSSGSSLPHCRSWKLADGGRFR